MTERVLVTGAAGLLGRRVLGALADRGAQTRALEHRSPAAAGDEIVVGDLLDPASLGPALRDVGAVVHLAAVTHARSPEAYTAVNVVGTRNLCAAAAAAGVRRFVHVSTRAIDPSGGAYSASKAAAEYVVRGSGLEWVIVRLPEVYGGGGSEGIDDVVRRGLAGRPIVVVGDGSAVLRPIHVDDAVAALVAALRSRAGQTLTLGGEPITMLEVARASAAAGGGRSRVVALPTWAVALVCRAARVLPLPVYPDQLERLTAPKPDPSPEAARELEFQPRPFSVRADAVQSRGAVDR